jgi:hypothetical protein
MSSGRLSEQTTSGDMPTPDSRLNDDAYVDGLTQAHALHLTRQLFTVLPRLTADCSTTLSKLLAIESADQTGEKLTEALLHPSVKQGPLLNQWNRLLGDLTPKQVLDNRAVLRSVTDLLSLASIPPSAFKSLEALGRAFAGEQVDGKQVYLAGSIHQYAKPWEAELLISAFWAQQHSAKIDSDVISETVFRRDTRPPSDRGLAARSLKKMGFTSTITPDPGFPPDVVWSGDSLDFTDWIGESVLSALGYDTRSSQTQTRGELTRHLSEYLRQIDPSKEVLGIIKNFGDESLQLIKEAFPRLLVLRPQSNLDGGYLQEISDLRKQSLGLIDQVFKR